MSKYEITNNKLFQDGVEITNTSVKELKEAGETLLRFAKFKEAVEKAAAQCFGEPKKRTRKTPAKETNPTPATGTAATHVANAMSAATGEGEDQTITDTDPAGVL